MTAAEEPGTAPVLRIVRGVPDDVEIAALVAVLSAGSGGTESAAEATPTSEWAAPGRRHRPAVHPTGWWSSALPR